MTNYLPCQIQTLLTLQTFCHSALQSFCDCYTKQMVYNDPSLPTTTHSLLTFLKSLRANPKQQILYHTRLYTFLDVMMFNISSNFERVRRMLEDALLESTDAGEFNQEEVIGRVKVADGNIAKVLERVVDSEEFCALVGALQGEQMQMVGSLTSLMLTLEYLARKYELKLERFDKTKQRVAGLLLPNFKDPSHKDLTICNNVLFCEKPDILIRLIELDTTETYETHFAILRLLQGNWVKARKDRKLFSECQNSGSKTFEYLLQKLLLKDSKHDIVFSQKHSTTIHFKFIHNYIVFRFMPVFLQFCGIFNKLNACQTQQSFYKENFEILKELSAFIKNLGESKFSNFLHRISKILTAKYTVQETIELIKMLFLNRFLLNPELKALYDRQNLNPKTYALTANRVRSLFFPGKLQTLPKQVIQLSNQLTKDYISLLRDHSIAAQQKRHLFLSDRILFDDYEHLANILSSSRHQLQFPSTYKQRPPISFNSFDTPGLSTVQKIQPPPDTSSMKVLINNLPVCDSKQMSSDRQPQSKRTSERSEMLFPPTRRDENSDVHNRGEEESRETLSEIQMVGYLQVLRQEHLQKSKHRQSFIDSQKQYKQRFNSEFSKISTALNSKLKQISETRTSYQLYVSSIL